MTATIDVPAHEHGRVHVLLGRFEDRARMEAYALPGDGAPWPLRDDLGATALDRSRVEAFPLANLRGMGLTGYLRMAYGVDEGQLAGRPELEQAALEEAGTHLVLIASRAFRGEAQTLRVPERLDHLGSFRDAEAQPGPAPSLGRPAGDADPGGPSPAPPEPEAAPRGGPGPRLAGAGAIVLGALLVAGGVLAGERALWVPGLVLAAAGAWIASRAPRRR